MDVDRVLQVWQSSCDGIHRVHHQVQHVLAVLEGIGLAPSHILHLSRYSACRKLLQGRCRECVPETVVARRPQVWQQQVLRLGLMSLTTERILADCKRDLQTYIRLCAHKRHSAGSVVIDIGVHCGAVLQGLTLAHLLLAHQHITGAKVRQLTCRYPCPCSDAISR